MLLSAIFVSSSLIQHSTAHAIIFSQSAPLEKYSHYYFSVLSVVRFVSQTFFWIENRQRKKIVMFSCVTQGICDLPILATFPQKLIIYRCKQYPLLYSVFLRLNLIHYVIVFFVSSNLKHPSMSIKHPEEHELKNERKQTKTASRKNFDV